MIAPLIKVIEKDPEERLKVQALQLLVQVSGQNMGLVAADWRKWWEIAEARFEFPKDGKKGSTGVGSTAEKCQLARPHGVFERADGLIFIADSENNRILQIEPG